MSLSDRLRRATGPNEPANDQTPAAAEPSPTTAAPDDATGPVAPPPPARGRPPADPLSGLKARAEQSLFSRLGARLYDSSMKPDQLRSQVHREIDDIIASQDVPLTDHERELLVGQVVENVIGYGPLQEFLDDDAVTEIMVTGDRPIYVERHGEIDETGAHFLSEAHLRRVIDRIVSQVGRRIDESSPMVDARLPDGSRVNAVIPPLALDGAAMTIRKFSRQPYTFDDLIGFGTLGADLAGFLEKCVEAKLSTIVSGGTGSGKTTLLNALSSFIGERERIITIEDAAELQLQQRHVVRMESRPPNLEGKGAVVIRDLVRNALRMRPDRIIVGEVRGGEALDMLQAMNTGHAGSITTLHANSPRDALARLETMVLMAGMDLPLRAIREQVASAIDLVVHTSRLADGGRRLVSVSEVTGMEGDVIQLNDLFRFDYSAGRDDDGRFLGAVEPTGLRPTFAGRLADLGLDLPPELFGDPARLLAGNGSRR